MKAITMQHTSLSTKHQSGGRFFCFENAWRNSDLVTTHPGSERQGTATTAKVSAVLMASPNKVPLALDFLFFCSKEVLQGWLQPFPQRLVNGMNDSQQGTKGIRHKVNESINQVFDLHRKPLSGQLENFEHTL